MNTPPISTDNTALLMIDMQNMFLHPDGVLVRGYGGLSPSLQAVTEPASRVLTAARDAGLPVIFTQHAYEPGYRDGGFLFEEILPKRMGDSGVDLGGDIVTGSWEVDFVPPFVPRPDEYVVPKNRYDAFIGTRLQSLLTRLGAGTLIVAGVVTTMCVESTVRTASMRDYRVYLVTDAIGDVDEPAHQEGLPRLSNNFAHGVTADEVCSGLGAVHNAAA